MWLIPAADAVIVRNEPTFVGWADLATCHDSMVTDDNLHRLAVHAQTLKEEQGSKSVIKCVHVPLVLTNVDVDDGLVDGLSHFVFLSKVSHFVFLSERSEIYLLQKAHPLGAYSLQKAHSLISLLSFLHSKNSRNEARSQAQKRTFGTGLM